MNVLLETIYLFINFGLAAWLFLIPLSSDFDFKTLLSVFTFLGLSGTCYWLNRRFKKNILENIFPNLRFYPLIAQFLSYSYQELGTYFPYALGYFFVKTFWFDLCVIPSGSMQPTFLEGDHVLLNRCIYGLRLPMKKCSRIGGKNPQKGDIVCFFPPTGTKNVFVKRVIGVAGDTVKIKGNAVSVIPKNAKKEDYKVYLLKTAVAQRSIDKIDTISSDVTPLKEENGGKSYFIQNLPMVSDYLAERSWEVPENSYFVMGDNRSDSQDSRSFGTVPRENIIATPTFIVWNSRWMNNQSFPTIQWKRFFRFIR